MFRWTRLPACAAVLQATTLQAHPGHGVTPPDSAAHYLLEPLHFAPMLGLLAVIAALVLVRRQHRSR